ncbi:MAG: TonB-dependent receptor [Balneolaceae bacterium]
MLTNRYSFAKSLLLLTFFAYSPVIHGQVTGIIVDAQNNNPVIGASIMLIESQKGTTTDINGRFQFDIDNFPALIRITAVGYNALTLTIDEKALSLRIELEPVVLQGEELFVEADRISISGSDSRSIASTRLQAEEFSNKVQASAPELLRAQPGVFVQQTTVGQGSVYVRGRAGRDVLYIFNGFRLNPGFIRAGQNQYFGSIDPFSISEIDIYRGPVSVYYGSDALSGGIHVKPVIKSYSSDPVTGGQFLTRGNIGGTGEKTVNGQLAHRDKNFTLFLNGTFRDFNSYKMPSSSNDDRLFPLNNNLNNADYQFGSLQGSGRFRLSTNLNLTWVSFYSRLPEAPRFDRMTLGFDIESNNPPERPRDGFSSNTAPLVFSAHSLTFQLSPNHSFISNVILRTGFHRLIDNRLTISFAENDRPFFSPDPLELKRTFSLSDERETDKNRSDQWLFSADFKSIINDNTILNWGSDFSYDRITSETALNGVETGLPRFPDGSEILSGGVFTHLNTSLSDRFLLESGFRFSWNRVDIPFEGAETVRGFDPFTQTFSKFTGSAGARYKFDQNWSLTGNISSGFRSPNVSDLSELGIRRSSQFQTANRNLKPEETINFDVGVHLNRGNLSINAHVFWLHYFNKIDRFITGNIVNRFGEVVSQSGQINNPNEFFEVQSANVGTMDIFGAELDATVKWHRHLDSGFTFTYTWGETDQIEGGRVPVDRIPPANGIIHLMYTGLENFMFRPQIRYAFAQRRISPEEIIDNRVSEHGTDGFINVQMITAWQGIQQVDVRLIADNLFNAQYREHASSLDGLSRNVTVSVSYNF